MFKNLVFVLSLICIPGSFEGFDLDNVWSIRKNVQVSSSIKNGTALKTTGKSFYSRHGGLTGEKHNNYRTIYSFKTLHKQELFVFCCLVVKISWDLLYNGAKLQEIFSNPSLIISKLFSTFLEFFLSGNSSNLSKKPRIDDAQAPGQSTFGKRKLKFNESAF